MNEGPKSIEYVEAKIKQRDADNVIEKHGLIQAARLNLFDGMDLQFAYEAGWYAALEYVNQLKDK